MRLERHDRGRREDGRRRSAGPSRRAPGPGRPRWRRPGTGRPRTETYGLVAVPSVARGRAEEPSPLDNQALWDLMKTRVPAVPTRWADALDAGSAAPHPRGARTAARAVTVTRAMGRGADNGTPGGTASTSGGTRLGHGAGSMRGSRRERPQAAARRPRVCRACPPSSTSILETHPACSTPSGVSMTVGSAGSSPRCGSVSRCRRTNAVPRTSGGGESTSNLSAPPGRASRATSTCAVAACDATERGARA